MHALSLIHSHVRSPRSLLFTIFYFFLIACSASHASETNWLTEPTSLTAGGSDGSPYLDVVARTCGSFTGYSCNPVLFLFKNKPKPAGGGLFYFKKVGLIRLQVEDDGSKDGSVIVRMANGTVRAQGGPRLWHIKMTLSPDSRMLILANGFNIIDSDFTSLLNGVRQQLASGSKSRVTPSAIAVPNFQQKVRVLEVTKPANGADELTDRIFINAQNNVPVEWDIFRKNAIVSACKFEDFQDNIELPDSLFNL